MADVLINMLRGSNLSLVKVNSDIDLGKVIALLTPDSTIKAGVELRLTRMATGKWTVLSHVMLRELRESSLRHQRVNVVVLQDLLEYNRLDQEVDLVVHVEPTGANANLLKFSVTKNRGSAGSCTICPEEGFILELESTAQVFSNTSNRS